MAFKDALAKQKPVGTATYTFRTLVVNSDKSPVLTVRHAGSGNPVFKSEVVRATSERGPRIGKKTERQAREDEEFTIRLFANGGVVESWQNVHEEVGEPCAQCTPDKVEEFLRAISESHPEEFFDFMQYCRDGVNFRDAPASAGLELGKK